MCWLVVRSKNTSPFTYSLDIMFRAARDYEDFKSRGLIDSALIAELYGIGQDKVLDIIFFDPALAEEFDYRCKQAGHLEYEVFA